MGWVGGINKVSHAVSETAFKAAKKQKSFLEQRGTEYLQGAYTMFDKDPIDTGESQKETTLQVINKKESIILRAKANTDQATFFIRGIGTNRKYGRRNVLKAGMNAMLKNVFGVSLKTGETTQSRIATKKSIRSKASKVSTKKSGKTIRYSIKK